MLSNDSDSSYERSQHASDEYIHKCFLGFLSFEPTPVIVAILISLSVGCADSDGTSVEQDSFGRSVQKSTEAENVKPDRYSIWKLGDRLFMATLAQETHQEKSEVDKHMAAAHTIAEQYQLNLPALPNIEGLDPRIASSLSNLYLSERLDPVAAELSQHHGHLYAATLRASIVSHILDLNYEPDIAISQELLNSFIESASQAELPVELIQPLIDVTRERKPKDEAFRTSLEVRSKISEYLRSFDKAK